ncbi:MOSC domain-containing protein [Sphingomonas crocodyli]|nr:MOSC domain-containing protein [Sphingomonas crocodyli]
MMIDRSIAAILTGRIQPLGTRAIESGIAKRAHRAPVRITRNGFAGDEQGDRQHHGGPDKAIHHYPRDHYRAWRAAIGDHPLLDDAGAFGENVSTTGLIETDVAIGDRFRLGTALVEVSQGRQPCFRLNLRFGMAGVARQMQDSGRTGWYYRVIEEGSAAPGDGLTLVDRLTPSWTIDRLRRIFYVDVGDRESLAAIAALAHLPLRWREMAAKRLQTGAVEDWGRRLDGA